MKKIKVIDLRLSSETGVVEDEELQAFLEDKEVVSHSEHFFLHETTPHLLLTICYQEYGTPTGLRREAKESQKNDPKKNWRATLGESDQEVYDRIRAWRGQRALESKLPAFVILGNRALSEVVQKRPTSLTQLQEIAGIGKMTAEKYGQEILEILAAPASQAPSEGASAPSEASKGKETTP